MKKEPFERVFSKIERKKLLQKAISEKVRVILKDSDNRIYEFHPTRFDSQLNILGSFAKSVALKDNSKVTALFYMQTERYFIVTRIKNQGDHWILLSDQQFYRLQRRNAFRVPIPQGLEMTFEVQSIRNIEVDLSLSVREFSSGGMRVVWKSKHKPGKGTVLKGSLQWQKGKVIPVDAILVHSPAKDVYGFRFINLNAGTLNRLKLLSIEIQQEIFL